MNFLFSVAAVFAVAYALAFSVGVVLGAVYIVLDALLRSLFGFLSPH